MLFRRNVRLLVIFLVVLAMAIFLIPGCGSDSRPGGKISAKSHKDAKSTGKGSKAAINAMSIVPGAIKQEPSSGNVEALPGISRAALDAIMAADQGMYDAYVKTGEAIPGLKMTEAEVRAKIAADQTKYDAYVKTGEAIPGLKMTEAEVRAKIAAEQKKFEKFRHTAAALPGMKMAEVELEAKIAAEKKMHEAQNSVMSPGQIQLDVGERR